jgi:hypothetical protein
MFRANPLQHRMPVPCTNRPTMIIRGPSKYDSPPEATAPPLLPPSAPTAQAPGALKAEPATFVATVYVAPSRCAYSRAFVKRIEHTNLHIKVVNIDRTRPPSWLPGVPTVMDCNGDGFCGDAAFEWLWHTYSASSAASSEPDPAPAPMAPMAWDAAARAPPRATPPVEEPSGTHFKAANDTAGGASMGMSFLDAYSGEASAMLAQAGDAMCINDNNDKMDDVFSQMMAARNAN